MKNARPAGFTLIEVIVAIILSAIAMTAILPMLDRVFQLSHEPRTTLQAGLSLQAAMDGLVTLHEAHSNDLRWLKANAKDHLPPGIGVAMNYNVEFTNGVNGIGREKPPYAVTTTNLLKITLTNALGERATRLFTVPPL